MILLWPVFLMMGILASLWGFPMAMAAELPSSQGKTHRFSAVPRGYGGGGRFTALTVHPKKPDILMIGSDVAGVFRSENGGGEFRITGNGLEGFTAMDIAFHPSRENLVALLTADGLYVSWDLGERWRKLSSRIRYAERFAGSRLMVFREDVLWVATDRDGIFCVRFTGSELHIEPIPDLEGLGVHSLTTAADSIWAATDQGVFRFHSGSWQAQNQGLNSSAREIVDITGHPHGRLNALEKSGKVYAWNDRTAQWEARGSPLSLESSKASRSFKAIALHPSNPDVLLVATHPEQWPHQLFRSEDGGRNWRTIQDFNLSPTGATSWARTLNGPERIVFSPRGDRVYLVDWWNVWEGSGGGDRWTQLHHGLQNSVINDIRVDPRNPKCWFVCAADNGLMVTRDGGKSWTRKMAGIADGHAQSLDFSHQDPHKMVLIVNPWSQKERIHVYRTTDGGETWRDIGFAAPTTPLPSLGFVDGKVTAVAIDPVHDDTVYVGTNGYGVFKSVNGGAGWEPVNHGLSTPYLKGARSLLVHPTVPGVLFACTQMGGVYKSTTGGKLWRSVTPHPIFAFGMVMDPANPSRILVACAEKKILMSENEGSTWKEIELPGERPPHIAVYSLAMNPRCPGHVFAGTLGYDLKAADGLFRSEDGGQTFQSCALSLPPVNINVLEALPEVSCGVLIGFNGIGVYEGRAE